MKYTQLTVISLKREAERPSLQPVLFKIIVDRYEFFVNECLFNSFFAERKTGRLSPDQDQICFRRFRDDFAPLRVKDHHIFNPHPEFSRNVDPGFRAHEAAVGHQPFFTRIGMRSLMDIQTETVTEAMAEI